ncbi:MAG: glutamate-5-semialdehyde dehydrogenase [Candidatus Omnitrophica bacterium]|nr:glutamate-5-semialdehyde dehydrogenase [Candidatus Omnitrophota bacterium]
MTAKGQIAKTQPAKLRRQLTALLQEAKQASRRLANASSEQRNAALRHIAESLRSHRAEILSANAADIQSAKRQKPSSALLDRLTLTDKRLEEMVASVLAIEQLPDPVGEVLRMWRRPNGLLIGKVRVPLGVVGIIYESRPNVTCDCAALCLKSGNAVVLRGGQESFGSNQAIAAALQEAVAKAALPPACVSLVPTAERSGVELMLQMDQLIDVIIPRGGEALIRKVVEQSRIPVIKHAKGVCHVYVDEAADLEMAQRIAFNAKCQRPATCNAMETLLVHQAVAGRFLPVMLARYRDAGVEVRGCPRTQRYGQQIRPASDEDWSTEYLDLILSVKVVDSFEEAVEHISRYGSAHSDAIVTNNHARAMRFLREVDSACVYVNASTRFTDGFQFGLGAEIGISTDKLHARGPMGLEELTTYKYIVFGEGQLRE